MYLTYAEYQGYGGTLSNTEFNNYEFRAASAIDYRTFDRLKQETVIPETVKRLMFQLIGLLQKLDSTMSLGQPGGGGANSQGSVTSYSNDGVSVSYNGMASTDLYTVTEQQIQKTIEQSLSGVVNSLGRKLLYRGLYPGE